MSTKEAGLAGTCGKGTPEAFWGGARAAMIVVQKEDVPCHTMVLPTAICIMLCSTMQHVDIWILRISMQQVNTSIYYW